MPEIQKSDKILRVKGTPAGVIEYDMDIYDGNLAYQELQKHINLDKWYYTNKKIPYIHNEYGYRSDNLSSINNNDYLLSFGCSNTYGQGLFYEDTYSYKISKSLNLKNINLGIPASGLRIQQLNTTLFVNSFAKIRLPKYVIYQYPNDYRVTLTTEDDDGRGSKLEVTTIGAADDAYINSEYTQKYYLKNQGEKYLQDLVTPLQLNNIWKALGVPVYHINFDDFPQEYKSDFQDFEILNIREGTYSKEEYLYYKARDLMHNGIQFHDKVKETILNKIKNG